MAKHTAKALRSGNASTSGSSHTAKAMNRRRGFKGANGTSVHTTKAMSRTRSMAASPQIQAVKDANKRRNFTGVPKTR